jgi:hypothetical protein
MVKRRLPASNASVAEPRIARPGIARPTMHALRRRTRWLAGVAIAAALAVAAPLQAHAAPRKTVCTITVNSSDEKEAFRRHLPKDQFDFVELVERGRPDWLETARRKGIRCDILVISGHYDGGDYAGGNEFFSEHVDAHEYLPVEEMERVACSASGDTLFSQLKAVYLFGCNTLNPEALRSTPAEIARNLERTGHAPAEAERLARAWSPRFADSSRDRMRHIFKDVPAVYGFSSVAPLGPTAATYLDRYFRAGGTQEVASGRSGSRILEFFPGRSLTLTRGSTNADPDAAFRRDVCRFFDDGLSTAAKVEFVHTLLDRDMAEVRLFLDRLERYSASLTAQQRELPDVARALGSLAADAPARARFLAFERASDQQPSLRVRMIALGEELGWLTAEDKRAEVMRLVGDLYARESLTSADVDLACTLSEQEQGRLAAFRDTLPALPGRTGDVAHAALLACLGSGDERARVLDALTSPRDADVQIAQVYLRHRPIADVNVLRDVAMEIGQMSDPGAQVRALDTLAHHRLSDPATLHGLARLFPGARSLGVQRAIAGILLRADYAALDAPDLVRTLREYRLKSPNGRDLIDVLISRLQTSS